MELSTKVSIFIAVASFVGMVLTGLLTYIWRDLKSQMMRHEQNDAEQFKLIAEHFDSLRAEAKQDRHNARNEWTVSQGELRRDFRQDLKDMENRLKAR